MQKGKMIKLRIAKGKTFDDMAFNLDFHLIWIICQMISSEFKLKKEANKSEL